MRARRALSLALLLSASVLAEAPHARAGDPEAHHNALVRANKIVAAERDFQMGAGGPEFMFPTDGYECRVSSPSTYCAYQSFEGQKVNEPDDWKCLDLRRPREMLISNLTYATGESLIASLPGVPATLAMACNYDHFVDNRRLPPSSTRDADSAEKTTWAWAQEIPDAIADSDIAQVPGDGEVSIQTWAKCDPATWKKYLGRVYNALHFAQDATCEHHAEGNLKCGPDALNPALATNPIYDFTALFSCTSWLANTLAGVEGDRPRYPCDEAVVKPSPGAGLNTQMEILHWLCPGLSLACMGLERTLRHHCDLGDSAASARPRKSIVCKGRQSDHDPNSSQGYCEGEPEPGLGGEDFVARAAERSRLLLEKAGRAWANVCGAPSGAGGAPGATAPDPGYSDSDPGSSDSKGAGGSSGAGAESDGTGGASGSDQGSPHGPSAGMDSSSEGGCSGDSCGGGPRPKARTHNDPHLLTLDGLAYDFQAVGEFVLFELTDDPQGPRAQVRQQPIKSDLCPQVTLNTAIAVSVNESRVTVYANDDAPLRVDGSSMTLDSGATQSLSHGGSVTAVGQNTWDVRWPDGARLRVERKPGKGEHHLDVSVFAPPSWRGRTRGLLGDFDGDLANEFKTRQGTQLATRLAWSDLYDVFGASYQIRPDESLFEPAVPGSILTYYSPGMPTLASMLPPDLLDGAEQICAATGVSDPTLREACILDVACNGGDSTQAEWVVGVPPSLGTAQIEYADRFDAAHCQTLTPAGFNPLERIRVPTDGGSVITKAALELGRMYKVRAWGTFSIGGPGDGLGDAEYSDFWAPPASTFDTCNGVDTGLAINAINATTKATRWGTECASHSYSLEMLGQGAPLTLNFHDCALADNRGTLNVDLFAAPACQLSREAAPLEFSNGGFETIQGGDIGPYKTLSAGSTMLEGWNIDAGEVDVVGTYWANMEGAQSIDLNGVKAGTISQVFSTVAGQTYDVSFGLAGNAICGPSVRVLEVEAANERGSFPFDVTGPSPSNMGWQQKHFAFRAISDETKLVFRSLADGSCGAALDDVRVTQICTEQ